MYMEFRIARDGMASAGVRAFKRYVHVQMVGGLEVSIGVRIGANSSLSALWALRARTMAFVWWERAPKSRV